MAAVWDLPIDKHNLIVGARLLTHMHKMLYLINVHILTLPECSEELEIKIGSYSTSVISINIFHTILPCNQFRNLKLFRFDKSKIFVHHNYISVKTEQLPCLTEKKDAGGISLRYFISVQYLSIYPHIPKGYTWG